RGRRDEPTVPREGRARDGQDRPLEQTRLSFPFRLPEADPAPGRVFEVALERQYATAVGRYGDLGDVVVAAGQGLLEPPGLRVPEMDLAAGLDGRQDRQVLAEGRVEHAALVLVELPRADELSTPQIPALEQLVGGELRGGRAVGPKHQFAFEAQLAERFAGR